MARLIAAFDWSRTALRAPENWPQCLKTTVSLMLRSEVPMVLLWGDDGIMTYNDAYSVFAGSRHPGLLGSRVREGWDEVADFNDNVMRVGLAGGTLHYEDQELILHRDGVPAQCWTNLDYSPVLDESGTPAGVLAIVVETTGKVLAERATKKAALWLQSYIAASSDVFYRVSADWTEIIELDGRGFVVDASVRTSGWMSSYVYEPDEAIVRAAVAAAIETKGPFELEHRVLQANGKVGWTFSRAVPVLDGSGEITEWFGVASDITERKRQETLEIAQNRVLALSIQDAPLSAPLEALVKTVEDHAHTDLMASILVVDGDGLHLRHGAAPSLPERYNHAVDGIEVGEGVGSCGTAAHRKAPVYVADIQSSELWIDFRDLAAESDLRACWSVPIFSGAGEVLGTFAIYHRECRTPTKADLAMVEFVTRSAALAIEHKRAVDNLRRSRAELEQRVVERTAELEKAHEALRQSQKMEAVGQLTGGLAHDFNNLLAGISGSLELMQTRMSQGRLKDVDRYVSAAQGATTRAAALTHRLLAFSRRQTLDPKPTDVSRLVNGMEDLVRRTVGPTIAVEVVGTPALWSVLVDPPQLENALLNLCINARDAMPDGGRITIETHNKWLDDHAARERDMEPGQYLSLCVSDTGTGMAADVIAKAFDPFFTTKPIGQGTGLGLSMIYGFARQSGGQVRIYSEVGEGTTVCIYLPRHYGDEVESEIPASLREAPRAEQGETVLVVDDEPTVRMLVTEVLEDLGYTAIEASDSVSGLKVLQSDVRIDLLVTDVGLPGGMNGRQMADAGIERRPGLKVLFITGYAENAALGSGHLKPGMQVLTKPFVMESLASRIRELIG